MKGDPVYKVEMRDEGGVGVGTAVFKSTSQTAVIRTLATWSKEPWAGQWWIYEDDEVILKGHTDDWK